MTENDDPSSPRPVAGLRSALRPYQRATVDAALSGKDRGVLDEDAGMLAAGRRRIEAQRAARPYRSGAPKSDVVIMTYDDIASRKPR